MRLTFLAGIAAISLGIACTDKARDQPTLSQRERDSIIGESRLPGASGVRGAMAAADSADALNRALEAIGGQ